MNRQGVFTVLFLTLFLMGASAILVQSAAADKPQWQKDIDWAWGNTAAGGSVDCPGRYASADAADWMRNRTVGKVASCIASGGRSCVLDIAAKAANAGEIGQAAELAAMCQCQTPDAERRIRDAGPDQVASYLRSQAKH